jgi:cytochrome c-type biogenesis protein CcmH
VVIVLIVRRRRGQRAETPSSLSTEERSASTNCWIKTKND